MATQSKTSLQGNTTTASSSQSRSTVSPISVVIATRNEASHIEDCIASVLASEGLSGPVDVIVVDGNSTDATVELVQGIAARDPRVRLISNPAGYAPHAFNIGIRHANGRHVMILSGHANLTSRHLAACVNVLDTGKGDIVGVVIETHPGGPSDEAYAVWLVMTHPLGFGPSRFRQGVKEPTEVDTVAFGAMNGDLFAKIGMFDEDLIRGQDDEFNARVRRHGGRILLLPGLSCSYLARTKISQLYRMCIQYGAFKPVSNIKAGNLISVRQFAPSAMLVMFAAGLVISLFWAWALLLPIGITLGYLVLSVVVARRMKNGFSTMGTWLVLKSFVAAHTGYGLGFLNGTLSILRYGKAAAQHLAKSSNLVRLSR